MERKFKDYMEQEEFVLQGTSAQGLCEKLSFWLQIDISKKNYWLFDFITIKFSSVPIHVLNLRVHLERVNLLISGGKPTDTPANILDWYNMGIAMKLWKNNWKRTNNEKGKNKTKRQVPRYRISILTRTAFAVQCSTHWAAGNLPCMERKFKDYM